MVWPTWIWRLCCIPVRLESEAHIKSFLTAKVNFWTRWENYLEKFSQTRTSSIYILLSNRPNAKPAWPTRHYAWSIIFSIVIWLHLRQKKTQRAELKNATWLKKYIIIFCFKMVAKVCAKYNFSSSNFSIQPYFMSSETQKLNSHVSRFYILHQSSSHFSTTDR